MLLRVYDAQLRPVPYVEELYEQQEFLRKVPLPRIDKPFEPDGELVYVEISKHTNKKLTDGTITVEEATSLLVNAPLRWWISGGHALELYMGERWRPHEDIDIGICRQDAGAQREDAERGDEANERQPDEGDRRTRVRHVCGVRGDVQRVGIRRIEYIAGHADGAEVGVELARELGEAQLQRVLGGVGDQHHRPLEAEEADAEGVAVAAPALLHEGERAEGPAQGLDQRAVVRFGRQGHRQENRTVGDDVLPLAGQLASA